MAGIFFFASGGVDVCMPRRKNRQNGQVFWASLPPAGAVELLRQLLLADPAVTVDLKSGQVQAQPGRFLLPQLIFIGRDTWAVQATFQPLSQKQYQVYRRRVFRCLEEVLGYTETQAKLFGLQSFRRTGDTLMWQKGARPEDRKVAGAWRLQESEEGYTEAPLRERMVVFSASTVS